MTAPIPHPSKLDAIARAVAAERAILDRLGLKLLSTDFRMWRWEHEVSIGDDVLWLGVRDDLGGTMVELDITYALLVSPHTGQIIDIIFSDARRQALEIWLEEVAS